MPEFMALVYHAKRKLIDVATLGKLLVMAKEVLTF